MGEQSEQVGAADAASVEPEHVEHQPGGEAFVQRDARAAVPREAGLVEVLAHQPGVGLVPRPDDADAMQRRAAVDCCDDGADRFARLFVGVGRIDEIERHTGGHLADSFDDHDAAVLGQGREQCLLGGPDPLGKEHDRGARSVRRAGAGRAQ